MNVRESAAKSWCSLLFNINVKKPTVFIRKTLNPQETGRSLRVLVHFLAFTAWSQRLISLSEVSNGGRKLKSPISLSLC